MEFGPLMMMMMMNKKFDMNNNKNIGMELNESNTSFCLIFMKKLNLIPGYKF